MAAIVVLSGVVLGGCASLPAGQVYDPGEKINRASYGFNHAVDKLILSPLSKGYVAVTPKPVRTVVSNFFDNSRYIGTVLNDFLQAKGKQGIADLGRFLVNSTLGVAGLFDPASAMGLEKHQEDFGQTLAVWGAPAGAYLVLPILGPDTIRNTPDLAISTLTDGLFYAGFFLTSPVMIPLSILAAVNQRSRASSAIRFVNESALDPYVFTREAWMQHRSFLIYDGHPPEPAYDDFEDDLPDDEGTIAAPEK